MKIKFRWLAIALPVFLLSPAAFSQCSNVTSGGTIGSDQTNCGVFNPAPIQNITLPAGGTGTLEYQWQSSPNGTSWNNISGATLLSFDPSSIASTVHYRRLSKRSGCTAYDGVSNTVIKTVNTVPLAWITPAGPLTFCGSVNAVLNATSGLYDHQWTMNGSNITGATSQSYTATTAAQYRVHVTSPSTG